MDNPKKPIRIDPRVVKLRVVVAVHDALVQTLHQNASVA